MEQTPPPPRVWAQEVNARFLRPLLDLLEERLGASGRDELLGRLGTSDQALRDERAWVSLRFLEALYEASVQATGSAEVLHQAGRAGLSRRYLGSLYHWGRFFGTPERLYAGLPQASERFNRVNDVELLSHERGRVALRYGARRGQRERSPLVCTVRREQLRAVPKMWGLPLARIEEPRCQSHGHAACVYDIRFHSPVRSIGTLLGTAVGSMLAACAVFSLAPPAALAFLVVVTITLLGATVGRVLDHRRALREARAHAAEQHDGLSQALTAMDSRFEALAESECRRDEAEARRRELEVQLRMTDRMSSLGMLAAGVAHEINNPLSYVVANLEYLSGEIAGDRARHELVEAAQEATSGARRVQRIARQLKTFSRREPEAERRPVALREALDPALTMVQGELRHRARLDVRLSETRAVLADAGELGQVFVNLLVNAAQALPAGQADRNEVRVRSYEDAEGCVVAEVSDTGPGIEGDHERIFEPFVTTKSDGTGLGLYICRRIVAAHGGTLEVDSAPGEGTTFRMRLPAVERPPERLETMAPELESANRCLAILIVDDEAKVARAIRRLLRAHETHVAPSVGEAKQQVLEHPELDAILCDLMIPDESGIELHRWLVETHPELGARTIFVSGGGLGGDELEYVERSGCVRLDKPVEAARLHEALHRVAQDGENGPRGPVVGPPEGRPSSQR